MGTYASLFARVCSLRVINILLCITRSQFTMPKEIQRRARATKHVAPLSIPLDTTITAINWSKILHSLRVAHRVKQRKTPTPPILPEGVTTPILPVVADGDIAIGSPITRNAVQLRRVLANVRFSGLTGPIQGRIDHLIRAVRRFLIEATNIQITRWWKQLHRQLPEPIFFIVYSVLKAVV